MSNWSSRLLSSSQIGLWQAAIAAPDFMNASRQVVILAVGASKAEACQAALGDERRGLQKALKSSSKSSIYH